MRNMRPKANFLCSASAALLLGGGLWGCVAGVDVSDEELATVSQQVGSAGTSSSTGGTGSSGSGSGGTGSSSLGGSSSSTGGTASSTGGTGSTAQGGTGSGGTGNPNTPPPAVGDCADATGGGGNIELRVLYTERPKNDEISMVLEVENQGNGFSLATLVLRYWFDDDGLNVSQATIDYTSAPGQVSITFGEELGSNYFDVNFSSTNDIGTGIQQIQIRLNAQPYATLNHTNDFSYSAGGEDVENRNITAYVDDVKVFGCEPGSGT
jgi:hypothetical protein